MDAPPQTGDLLMAVARRVRRAHLDALADWQVTPSQARDWITDQVYLQKRTESWGPWAAATGAA